VSNADKRLDRQQELLIGSRELNQHTGDRARPENKHNCFAHPVIINEMLTANFENQIVTLKKTHSERKMK